MKAKPSKSPPTGSPDSAPDLTGQQFGDFRIVRKLGQGGMGQVYLAEQVSLARKVAIKVLREDLAANPTALARFVAESKTVAQISHPNVVGVHMIGERNGRSYMVLEYVDGKSLAEYLALQGPLEVSLVLSIMRQVASGLNRASEMGIVHRDIKPANILLTRKGQAKIADFGLARCLDEEQPVDLTRAGTAVGTPLYMSPEQIEGKSVDSRSDIYSFGVTCFHMLAGRPPFRGNNAFEVGVQHVREEPPPLGKIRPDIPLALVDVVRKMLAKKPRDRHQSAQELLEDIARVRGAVGGTTESITIKTDATQTVPTAEPTQTIPVPIWKRPAILLAGAGALALALGLFVVLIVAAILWQRTAPQPEADKVPVVNLPAEIVPVDGAQAERTQALKKAVAKHLAEKSPNPNGVEDCIDLAVLFLDQNNVREARELFDRMSERRPPSAYHFVGRLGLAVTDALEAKPRESHLKFTALFDSKSKDNRVQVLNDYLTRNPEFAKWVNEADSHNVRNGGSRSSIPSKLFRFGGKKGFKKS